MNTNPPASACHEQAGASVSGSGTAAGTDENGSRKREAGALGRWLKRIGLAGFLFFLLKGVAWLVVLGWLIARGAGADD